MLLSFAVPVKGDDMTDAVRAKLKLQNEKKELLSQLNDLKLENAKLQKQKSLKEDTIQLLEDSIERVKNKINPDSLKRIRQIAKLYKNELATLDVEIAQLKETKGEYEDASQNLEVSNSSMAKYEVELIKKEYEENKELLYKSYSKITIEEIAVLEASMTKFKTMNGYVDYENAVSRLKMNKLYYDNGVDLLRRQFQNEPIKEWREKFEAHTKNLDENHFEELDSLDIKLSRYKGGILKFQEIITEVEKIANNAKPKEEIKKELNNYFASEDIKKYENRYAKNIKWLGDRYYNFKNKKQKDPDAECKSLKNSIMDVCKLIEP